MRIGVIGAGSVGRALATAFTRLDHDVVVGVRDPGDERHRDLAGATRPADAADGADLVVLAVPATSLTDAVPSLELRAPTVVADATNMLGGPVPGGHATVGELTASLLPDGVHLVKAFNTIGAEHMIDGSVDGTPAFLPIAGDDAALGVVVPLARQIGFDAVAVGGRESFALVEQHAALWIRLMRTGWGRDFGFAVVGAPNRTA
jgi:predicted dinucleotide-binding enzyme